MINLTNAATPAAKTPAARTLCVSKKVVARIEADAKNTSQAQIAVGGPAMAAGPVTLKVKGTTYQLVMTKGTCMWVTSQTDETKKAFEDLFNVLAATPGEKVPYEM